MAARVPSIDPATRQPLRYVAGLALLLVVMTLAVGGFFLFRPAQPPAAAARIATDTFVSRLIAGDYGGAYAELCADTRQRLDRDQFVSSVGGRPAVRSYQVEKVAGSAAAGFTVDVTLADPTGATARQVLRIVRDRGAWRVCGDPVPVAGG